MLIDRMFAVTPSDTIDQLAGVPFVIYVGGAGNVKVTTSRGDVITFTNLAAGFFHPFFVRRVWSTTTTATGIIGGRD